MLLPAVSLLIVFCFGCCNAEPNANLRLRLSAKILDVLVDTIANKGKRFAQYADFPTRIGGKIGDVQYHLYTDSNTAELSLQLTDLNVYEDHLHRIDSANFSLGIQIHKNPSSDNVQLILSKCNFTATSNTNSHEISYLTGSLQDQVCRMLHAQLKFYQSRTLHTESGVMHIACGLVEPSGVFPDRIEVTVNCNATVRNKIGETTTIEANETLPPMPMFIADEATVEIQSSGSLHEAVLLAIRPVPILGYSVTQQSTTPLFTQIVPILSQIAVATGEYPILNLVGRCSHFSISGTHVQIKLDMEEKIISYRDKYLQGYPGTLLHCSIDWKLNIQMSDGPHRWFNVTDLPNANVTFDDIKVKVIESKLNNTAIVDKMCNQLHTTITRNQIAEEINSNLLTNYYQVFLQDSAIVLKVDYGKLLPMMFGGIGPLL